MYCIIIFHRFLSFEPRREACVTDTSPLHLSITCPWTIQSVLPLLPPEPLLILLTWHTTQPYARLTDSPASCLPVSLISPIQVSGVREWFAGTLVYHWLTLFPLIEQEERITRTASIATNELERRRPGDIEKKTLLPRVIIERTSDTERAFESIL